MKRRPERDPMEKARELSQFMAAKTDPLGSWTGQPRDLRALPEGFPAWAQNPPDTGDVPRENAGLGPVPISPNARFPGKNLLGNPHIWFMGTDPGTWLQGR